MITVSPRSAVSPIGIGSSQGQPSSNLPKMNSVVWGGARMARTGVIMGSIPFHLGNGLFGTPARDTTPRQPAMRSYIPFGAM